MSPFRRGRIRIKTLRKFLHLYNVVRVRGRMLTAREVSLEIGCCLSHAYNYMRALERLLRSQLAT